MEKRNRSYNGFGLQMLQQFAWAKGHSHKINRKIAVNESELALIRFYYTTQIISYNIS